MAIRATGSPRAGNEERRFDTDGQLYTKAEFVGEYGGTREWEQAEPEVQKQEQPNAMLNTEDVLLISHTHGRERRAERSISRIELQAAVKHGRKEPAHPSAQGLQRWRYTYNGIVYVTDASSRHEITSWRDDGQDTPVQARGPGLYGAHVVLIVDASGSMRANDVKGYASRTAAVYECLARDLVQPQGNVGFQSHYGNAVVSLIEMSDQAEVLKKQAPMDTAFADYLRDRASNRASSHGNYLPALETAMQLLAESRQDARLLLIFLSDGEPSDHVGMPCSHGIKVWSNDNTVKPDGTGKNPLCLCKHVSNSAVCRQEVKTQLKKQCLKSVTQLGVRFGRERVVVATVAFGDPQGDYTMLQEMAKQLPRGSFHEAGLDANVLRTAFSSFSSSLTSLRTESAGGNALTLRKVAAESSSQHRASLRIEGDGWHVCMRQVKKYEYSVERQGLREVPMEATGIAFRKASFAQGAERFAHRGSEVVYSDPPRRGLPLERTGHWLVTKMTKHEELLFDLSFHETFCRLHEEARGFAATFNELVAGIRPNAFSIRFVRCSVYECSDAGELRRLGVQGGDETLRRLSLSVLVEQELEGEYMKYNNNAGRVRASRPGDSGPLGMILEEDKDEDEEYAAEPDPIDEAPQCFSHFSLVASDHEKLVCDLQGTWNATDGYLLTDPVVHRIGLEKHANGNTDKGLSGIVKFFDTHKCGPLCKALRLPPPSECVEMAREKQRRLELQHRREEQQAAARRQRERALEHFERERRAAEQRTQEVQRRQQLLQRAQQAQQQRRAYEQAYAQELECEERKQQERDLRDTLRQQQEMRQEQLRRQQLRRQEAERERMRRQEQQDCVIL